MGTHRRRGDKIRERNAKKYAAKEEKKTKDEEKIKNGEAACKVTTHRSKDCSWDVVGTYISFDASGTEWTWYRGKEEDLPVSAKIQGECGKVEFYDEDSSKGEGYTDNVVVQGNQCTNFPYDLRRDLGGLKVFAKATAPALIESDNDDFQGSSRATHRRRGDKIRERNAKKYAAKEEKKTKDEEKIKNGEAACKVTTHQGKDCSGDPVGTYISFDASGTEWKWYRGREEDFPVSAKIQ